MFGKHTRVMSEMSDKNLKIIDNEELFDKFVYIHKNPVCGYICIYDRLLSTCGPHCGFPVDPVT